VRRLLPLLIALPVVALALAPATSAQDAPSPASSGYTVRGTVVNAITGQPEARALVSIVDDQAVLTDSNGQFSFDNVSSGNYPVSVSKPGFEGRGTGMAGIMMRAGHGFIPPRPSSPIRIQVGPDMPALTVRITPLAAITGHVTLSTADPADGFQIQAFVRQLRNGHPQWTLAGLAHTRSDGSFRIGGLAPGSYRLATLPSLDRPGQGFNSRSAVWGYPSLYYPGTTDAGAAGILNLGAGQQAEADITLVRQQFFPVVAIVHSSSETPANFEILDSGGRQTGLFARWDRSDGVVRATVPNGTWTMEANVYGRNQEWGSTPFQVNGAPASLAINVQPMPPIPVVIRREFLASADGSQPQVPDPGLSLELTDADGTSMVPGGMIHNDNSSAASPWELNVTKPGRYWIRAQSFLPAYVSSITSGGVDLGSNPLVVVPGSTPAPVEVTLRNDGGTVAGTVDTHTPGASSANTVGESPQVWIYAIPLFSTAAGVPEGSLQSNGQFTIPNLAPGPYRIVACDAQQEIDFHSPEGLAAWAGKGQTATVEAGGTASVELDIVHINPEVEEEAAQ